MYVCMYVCMYVYTYIYTHNRSLEYFPLWTLPMKHPPSNPGLLSSLLLLLLQWSTQLLETDLSFGSRVMLCVPRKWQYVCTVKTLRWCDVRMRDHRWATEGMATATACLQCKEHVGYMLSFGHQPSASGQPLGKGAPVQCCFRGFPIGAQDFGNRFFESTELNIIKGLMACKIESGVFA